MDAINVISLDAKKIKIIGAKSLPEASQIHNNYRIQTSTTDSHDQFFTQFHNFFQKLAINISDKDEIYRLTIDLLKKQCDFIKLKVEHYMKDDCYAKTKALAIEITEESTSYITNNLNNKKTEYKRQMEIKNNRKFVPPVPKSVGLIWESKVNPITKINEPTLTQAEC